MTKAPVPPAPACTRHVSPDCLCKRAHKHSCDAGGWCRCRGQLQRAGFSAGGQILHGCEMRLSGWVERDACLPHRRARVSKWPTMGSWHICYSVRKVVSVLQGRRGDVGEKYAQPGSTRSPRVVWSDMCAACRRLSGCVKWSCRKRLWQSAHD